MTLTILLSTRYILWRALYTLNTASRIGLSLSLILLLAEIYGVIQLVLFFVQSVNPTNPISPKVEEKELPTVDVFIPIYNEPPEILYRTLVGCQALDYPAQKKKIYVLDDGRREEIRDMATKLGCRYLTRADNKYAKAGNLNNGLRNSEGEILAFFDCDQVPVRSFLKETIGFFKDPKVALVHTPQHFYNPDIFQKNLRIQSEISHEQDMFFRLIQPGRDYFNSAFFCGSGGLFRRSALEEIGGFTQYSVTEDLATSIELHSKGYKSTYLNKTLSAGLSPESCAGYINQRKRWTKGAIQVFFLDNPLFKKGLNFFQRLNYFAALYYFFHGFPRIVYLSWPLMHLLFDYSVIITHIPTFVHYFSAHYIPSIVAFNLISKRHRNPFFNDVYETVMSFPVVGAVFSALFQLKEQRFSVTPKGERFERSLMTPSVIPHIILFGLLLLGIGVGFYKLTPGNYYQAPLIICLFWASYNALVLLVTLFAAKGRPHKRDIIRLARGIKAELILPDKRVACFTKDISEVGCSLVLANPEILPDSGVRLQLISNYGEITKLKAKVVRYDRDRERNFTLGIEFIDPDEATRQSLIRQMHSPADSWQDDRPQPQGMWEALFIFLTAPLVIFVKDKFLRRFSPRFNTLLHCEIILANERLKGITRDISSSGLSIELQGRPEIPNPKEVDIRLIKNDRSIELRGRVMWKEQGRERTLIGVRFLKPFQGNYIWKKLGY